MTDDSNTSKNPDVTQAYSVDRTLDMDAPNPSRSGSDDLPRDFGDYELIDEIARGGMGVVYRARQRSLNRVVAVKMILAGRLAGEAQVQRFYAEAEAAANLQHPNIVAIHDVGTIDKQHYFSMEFVEGYSLADAIKTGSLTPNESATLLRIISDAIHFAHERGVIHRDLKPQNILIDTNGQPRVTDFGLAKRVENDSELTTTGAILGTPSYMSPEQADAQHAEVGTVSDVYSLGAILYEMITGRPPFQSENTFATLVDVIEAEPAAPTSINKTIPRDLETICLKCLAKDPNNRYASAEELANDLDRFLQREPIAARRLGPLGRAMRWARRKPLLAVSCTGTAVFYGYHLFAMLVLELPGESGFFHWFVTIGLSIFVLATIAFQRMMDSEHWRGAGRYSYQFVLTAGMVAGFTVGDPQSAPYQVILLLICGSALIEQSGRMVWYATGLVLAGYTWILVFTAWRRSDDGVSVANSIGMYLSIIVMGFMMYLLIRRSRVADTDRSTASRSSLGRRM